MSREIRFTVTNIAEWMGNQAPVMQALADTPSGYVPDASFRDWPDESKQALGEEEEKESMSLEALAYCHSFLRNDLNVLVLLAIAEKGIAHAHEIAQFLCEQDLDQRATLDRTHVAPVLRELSACAYSGIYKASDDPYAPYEQLANVEGLVSMAGHLYGFSKEHSKPLADFLGPARGQKVRPDSTIYDRKNISNTVDRIKIVRHLKEAWEDNKYSDKFATNQRAIEDATGIRAAVLEPQLKNLAQHNFIHYQTTGPNDGPHQEYRWNRNGRKRKQWTREHGAFADYLHEYVMLIQTGLSRQGARDYLLENYPTFTEMDQVELDKRIEYTLNGLLARSFIRPDTPFVHGSQSSIGFPRGTDGMSLVDYACVLDTMQKEDTQTVKEGLTLAREISVDRQGVTLLLRKAGK